MGTRIRIDDDLVRELRGIAKQEGVSLTRLVNRLIRQTVAVRGRHDQPAKAYRERTFAMGEPTVDLDKAMAVANGPEDDAVREKLAQRK